MSGLVTLGADVRRRRRELHLTQERAAELAGVSTRFVGSVEHGKASLRLDSLAALLDALGLELHATLRRPDGQ